MPNPWESNPEAYLAGILGVTPDQAALRLGTSGDYRRRQQQETRGHLLTHISSLAGGPSSRIEFGEFQTLPGYAEFARRAAEAGLDPAELITQRNQNIHDYETGGLASRVGDFMDRTGLGDLITYGTIATAGLGALGGFGVGPFGGSAAGGAAAGGATGAGADALGVSLPSSAVPIGTGTSLDALAGTGLASLPAAVGGGAGVAGGIGSRILGALGGSSGSPWLTIGQIGASLIGGAQGANAAEDAADAQARSAADALDFQRESRDIALGLIRPEVEASQAALGRMLDMTGTPRPESLGEAQPFDIKQDPSYQFRLDEGMRALENSAAARGNLNSGGFARRALRYAQDYASTEYANIYNRLASIANRTPIANSQGNIALNFGTNAANLSLNQGDARASGYIAQSNSWQNAMNQIALALGRNFGQPAGQG